MQRRDKVSQFGAFLPFGSGMVERVVYIIYRCLASQLQQRPGAVPEKGTRKKQLDRIGRFVRGFLFLRRTRAILC